MKRIIFFDGPAGGGKSTLARWVSDRLNYPLVTGSLNNRAPSKDSAPYDSLQNDTAKLIRAVESLNRGPNTVLVDRMVFPERVYGRLRQFPYISTFKDPGTPPGDRHELFRTLARNGLEELDYLMTMVCKALSLRLTHVERPREYLWVFYTPNLKTINKRRWMRSPSGTDFAWAADQEWHLYSELVQGLMTHNSPFHKILWEVDDDLLNSEFLEVVRGWIDEDPK